MSSPDKPYQLTRWDAPSPPSPGLFDRWLVKSALTATTESLAPGPQTEEMLHPTKTVYILLAGSLQCAMPGYGVVDLQPGDQLEVAANTRHDLKAHGQDLAQYLRAIPA